MEQLKITHFLRWEMFKYICCSFLLISASARAEEIKIRLRNNADHISIISLKDAVCSTESSEIQIQAKITPNGLKFPERGKSIKFGKTLELSMSAPSQINFCMHTKNGMSKWWTMSVICVRDTVRYPKEFVFCIDEQNVGEIPEKQKINNRYLWQLLDGVFTLDFTIDEHGELYYKDNPIASFIIETVKSVCDGTDTCFRMRFE